uniref:Mannosylglycerate hydrolase MGH1-like glycoside hydrolase domain-containing protein n=1 Tax=Dictyoglomus thermophilum TaxID=14 RepID=A0A7C3MJG3_DICTH
MIKSKYELSKIPFTRRGSYIRILLDKDDNILIGHLTGGDDVEKEIIKIIVNEKIKDISMLPYLLKIEYKVGELYISFSNPNILKIKTYKLPIKLEFLTKSYDYVIERNNSLIEFNCSHRNNLFLFIKIEEGEYKLINKWNGLRTEYSILSITPIRESCELAVLDFKCENPQYTIPSFDESVNKTRKEFEDFSSKFKISNNNFQITLAKYILWANTVSPRGLIKYEGYFSSKNKMTNIWSWDVLFTIIPIIEKFPDLSFDNLRIFFSIQGEDGLIPDFINDIYFHENFCKPPIIGYIFKYFLKNNLIAYEDLKEFYEPLKSWGFWWLNHRDDDKDFLIQYNHGNESGWDNSTVFKKTIPVESPDLNSYLIILFDLLSDMAQKLKRYNDYVNFKEISEKLFDKLIKLWNQNEFIVFDQKHNIVNCNSLQKYIPLILTNKLPLNIIEKIIINIQKRFITQHGLTTEAIDSPDFDPKGYWRGPIWGPTTFLLTSSLEDLSFKEFSTDIKTKFIKLVLNSYFNENFDPITGEGLCDTGFSWTSSIFLKFLEEIEKEGIYETLGKL